MGCDINGSTTDINRCSFNPRTRMGCDTLRLKSKCLLIGFNPRTRMGCDSILSNELNIIVQIYRICE